MLFRGLTLAAALAFNAAAAGSPVTSEPRIDRAPEWREEAAPCWEAAGTYHGVDPWLLYAIAYVESRHNPQAVGINTNGTRDLGIMQINSSWLPELRRWGVPDTAWKNACASNYIGAWILASNFRRYGQSWQAIAAYNVGSVDTPRRFELGLAYARKVYATHAALVRAVQHRRTASAVALASTRR